MLLLIHLLLHGTLGCCLGLRSQRLRTTAAPAAVPSKVLWGSVYLNLISIAPLVAYQLRLWPSYALAYAFDPLLFGELYAYVPGLCLFTLLALPGTLALTTALSAYLAAHGRGTWAGLLLFSLGGAAAWLLVALCDSWLTIADFGTYWRGGGTPIYAHLHARMLCAAYLLGFALVLAIRQPRQRQEAGVVKQAT